MAATQSILERILELLSNQTVSMGLGALGLFILQRVGRHFLTIWSWWQWELALTEFAWRHRFRNHKPVVACIDEYVTVLESLRNRLVKRCPRIRRQQDTDKPELFVYVYTRQLPSDWPLWDKSIDQHEPAQTALEQYVRDFKDFLTQANHLGYTVQLRRIIVIDNGKTDKGIERCKQLVRDRLKNAPFDAYVNFLHGGNVASAKVHWTERPWPGWLSDAVFYGIKEPGQTLRWLWGVTTSYDAGEDLILLRLHGNLKARLDSHYRNGSLRLPDGVTTLHALAMRAEDYPGAIDLEKVDQNWEPWK